jgi:hypothetical protein
MSAKQTRENVVESAEAALCVGCGNRHGPVNEELQCLRAKIAILKVQLKAADDRYMQVTSSERMK